MERRFFIAEEDIHNNLVTLMGEEHHYAVKVLRLTEGETVTLIGQKNIFKAKVTAISKHSLTAQLFSQEKITPPLISIDLFQGLPKAAKFDLVIEKCTELGIDTIYPLLTERTVVTVKKESLVKKLARWQKIAREATRQSRRTTIPQVKPPLFLEQAAPLIPNYNLALVFWEKATDWLPEERLKRLGKGKLSVFVGPEGGFSEAEVELLKSKDALVCSLGPRILRTETVPIAVLAILNFIFKR